MNWAGGLVDQSATREEREASLRRKLPCENYQIAHPLPGVSIAWSDNTGLSASLSEQNCFAFIYGSAYSTTRNASLTAQVDDPASLARIMLSRYVNGEPLLTDLAGSFVVAVGNADGEFLLAGDLTGGRAPYVSVETSRAFFATHPILCAKLLDEPAVDRSLEDFLLIYGFLPDGRTIYQNVRQLSPGQALQRSGATWRTTSLELKAGHTSCGIPDSEEALYDALYDVLLQCTTDQLAGTQEVGLLLGGFDSALVAALLRRIGKSVRTYSFRYTDSSYNQPHIEAVASYLGCDHSWIDITPDMIADGLDTYGDAYVQPTNWFNYLIQTTELCRRMRGDGLASAYSGDGCDAVFLGYPGTYKRTRTFSRLPSLSPTFVAAMARLCAWPSLDRAIGHPYRVAMNVLRATGRPMPARAFLSFRVFDEVTVRGLKGSDSPPQEEPTEVIVRRLSQPYSQLSVQRMGYAAKAFVSPNRAKLLACADVAGVRVHSPYLHPALRAFAAQVPDQLLREQDQSGVGDPGKICLMRMAERHQLLPSDVIQQPKMAAIDAPIDEWIMDPVRPAIDRAVAGLPFQPTQSYLESLIHLTRAERLYKRYIGSTRVISDGISLLATYGSMCKPLTGKR